MHQIEKLTSRRKCPPGDGGIQYRKHSGHIGPYDISRCCHIWHKTTVRRILEDERYTGTYIMGKREVTEVGGHHVRLREESQWVKIPGHHPAIVSREMFEEVQDQLAHVKCGAKAPHSYPLRGKVFCGCCLFSEEREKISWRSHTLFSP